MWLPLLLGWVKGYGDTLASVAVLAAGSQSFYQRLLFDFELHGSPDKLHLCSVARVGATLIGCEACNARL